MFKVLPGWQPWLLSIEAVEEVSTTALGHEVCYSQGKSLEKKKSLACQNGCVKLKLIFILLWPEIK